MFHITTKLIIFLSTCSAKELIGQKIPLPDGNDILR